MTAQHILSLIKTIYPTVESADDDLEFAKILTGYSEEFIKQMLISTPVPNELNVANIVLAIIDEVMYISGAYGIEDDAFGL